MQTMSAAVGVTTLSLEHLKKKFVEKGLPAAIERKKRVKPPREIFFGGEFEAHLLALACSDAPKKSTMATHRIENSGKRFPNDCMHDFKKINLSLT